MANNPYKPKKNKKKLVINTKNMGVNIDKNEYYEIILSNSARPDDFKKKFPGDGVYLKQGEKELPYRYAQSKYAYVSTCGCCRI